jgi:branched-chain amino acid transport system permease protein
MTTFLTFVIIGLVTGAIYAIAATGLVLSFTTSRIFNLAHGAVGMFLAFIYNELWTGWGVPRFVSFGLTIFVIGPLLGAVMGQLVMRHLARAPVAIRLTGTLSLFVLFEGLALVIWGPNLRPLTGLVSDNTFRVLQVRVTYNQLTTVLIALGVAIGLWAFLHRTRLGTAMRAVVDDPDLAELMGISPNLVQSASWSIGTSLAGLAAILIAPNISLNISQLSLLVVSAFAAAIIGRLSSIGWTYAGGLGIGIASSLLANYLPVNNQVVQDLPPAMPFLVLFVALVVFRQERQSLQKLQSIVVDPPPRVASSVTWCVVGIGTAAFLAPHLSNFVALVIASGLAYGAILLSLVLLTGMAGQVSLCQFSFVGIGGALVTHLAPHMPYAVAALAAAVITGMVGALIALPALRLRGLYVALATFAFAILCDNLIFQNSHVFGTFGEAIQSPSPTIFGLTLRSHQSYVIAGACLVAVLALAIQSARRGRFGRALAAMRDSPVAASALGLSLVRAKVLAFGISAAMAGLAGCFYAGLQGQVGGSEYTYLISLTALLILSIQGVTAVPGAVLGGAFYALLYLLVPQWTTSTTLINAVQPLTIGLAVLSLLQHPEGAWTLQARLVRELLAKRRGRGQTGSILPLGATSAAGGR